MQVAGHVDLAGAWGFSPGDPRSDAQDPPALRARNDNARCAAMAG